MLSIAGVKVRAINTAMAMESAPTVPITPRNGIPVTLRASSAMRTVEPAKTTALPGRAVGEADRLVHAVAFLELAAVAVDDEQRVVDADREAEHDARGPA